MVSKRENLDVTLLVRNVDVTSFASLFFGSYYEQNKDGINATAKANLDQPTPQYVYPNTPISKYGVNKNVTESINHIPAATIAPRTMTRIFGLVVVEAGESLEIKFFMRIRRSTTRFIV